MNGRASLIQEKVQRQAQILGTKQLQGLGLLVKSLPELRAELLRSISENPVIEDLDHPLETPLSDIERKHNALDAEAMPDYPEDRFEPVVNRDEDAAERRQAFFDSQVKVETLQEHLLAQLPLSDIGREDWNLVEVLVGDLNDDGFYTGSIPDACMAFGKTEAEIRELLRKISELDPPGCAATSARECLLAQIDALDGSPYRDTVRKMIDRYLPDIAAGRSDDVARALGTGREHYMAALRAMRTLSAHPGSAFPGERDRAEYVNPEVHACKIDGKWCADTDKRSLPEIRIAKKYLDLLKDPKESAETKEYVRDRIAAARDLREAVVRRQETVEGIAQAIFDRQEDFFERGFAALKPLTENEIAKAVGVDPATVSRTVRGKYAATPFGTVELRRFFVSGVQMANGKAVAQDEILTKLAEIVRGEDAHEPLSDEKLAQRLKADGFPVARRTIAKYRGKLGIPGAQERKK